MSQVSDAFTGSSGSGTSDTTLSDLSLGDALTGGTGDPFGDAAATSGDVTASDAGGGGFQNFNNLTAALGGAGGGAGASPVAAQSASMTPPSSAAQTGGDPTGAAGGTQSSTSPGQTPSNQQSGGTQQNQQQNQDPNYAPPSAVNELKALLKQLNTGKVPGPSGPTPQGGQNQPWAQPTMSAVQTGNPPMPPPRPMALPALAAGQTGEQSPQMALPEVATGETGPQSPGPAALRQRLAGQPATDAQGNPVTAAGTPAADTPLPPTRPADLGQTAQAAPAGQGRDITVQKAGAGAQPQPDLPTKPPKQLPTHKPGPPEAQPQGPPPAQQPPTDTHSNIPPSRLIQDIAGISTGRPSALADLARAAGIILPMFMGGGRRGRFGGGFRGGRFTHGIGGFGHLHGGRHPAGPGAWPYHHPQFGWHMHAFHPGGGWRPLHPNDGQAIVGGGGQGGQDPNAPPQQDPNAPDPDRPPKETGRAVGTPDSVGSSGAIPNVGAKEVDDYTRKVAQQYNIDPNVASRVLAQESSYGQARKPGDNGTSFGPFQLHFAPDGKAMGDQFMRDTGLDPRDPRTWKQQIDYAMMKAAQGGWKPWTTTMNKLGMNEWSGINRTFAGQPYSRDPAGMSGAASIPVGKLPPRSQPSVAG